MPYCLHACLEKSRSSSDKISRYHCVPRSFLVNRLLCCSSRSLFDCSLISFLWGRARLTALHKTSPFRVGVHFPSVVREFLALLVSFRLYLCGFFACPPAAVFRLCDWPSVHGNSPSSIFPGVLVSLFASRGASLRYAFPAELLLFSSVAVVG